MEDFLKKQNCGINSRTTSSPSSSGGGGGAEAIGMNKNSQIIAKVKPKIRIIHIFAPEIIKTDVANFRELVQRLTGKPTEKIPRKKSSKKNSIVTTKKTPSSSRILPPNHQYPMIQRPFPTKLELIRSGFLKGEEEIWRNANSGEGFLGGFAELEGFMEQLNHDQFLPLPLPLEAAYHHHMDAFGQSQLA